MKNDDLIEELERIRHEDPDDRLRPEAVVTTVRSSPGHPLRQYFTWDPGKALDKLHLIEARKLINRVYVTYTEHAPVPVRVYCSLTTDRGSNEEEDGGGYRHVQEVLSNARLKEILLDDALSELRSFERKYLKLRELAEVIEASRKARRVIEGKKKAPRKKAKKKAATGATSR